MTHNAREVDMIGIGALPRKTGIVTCRSSLQQKVIAVVAGKPMALIDGDY